jgi:flavin-dependent dehydrogenase
MKQPDLVVERAAIVGMLAKKAIQAGVEIRSGCKFLDLEPAEKGVMVTIRNIHRDREEKFQTRTLIGADGTFSRVAKIADCNGYQTTPILQAIVDLPRDGTANTTRVWFQPEDTPYFYWMIPESHEKAVVGFITREGKDANAKLKGFLSRRGLKALDIQAARVPTYTRATQPWRRISDCDIFLVGDAAGQVKVTTVGGLVTGLRGAKAAANAILQRVDYRKELRSLRRELGLHLLIRSALDQFKSADYDRLLDLLDGNTLKLLGQYNRDHAVRMIFRLLIAQPRLLRFSPFLSHAIWQW